MNSFKADGAPRLAQASLNVGYDSWKISNTGVYYPLCLTTSDVAMSTSAVGANTIALVPFYAPNRDVTMDDLRVNVTTATAAAAICGIYEAAMNQAYDTSPCRLVAQTATFTLSATGVVGGSISAALKKNRLYLAAFNPAGAVTIRGFSVAGSNVWPVGVDRANVTTPQMFGFSNIGLTYTGSLPNTLGSVINLGTNYIMNKGRALVTVPLVFGRFA